MSYGNSSASTEIDAIIANADGWRGAKLAELRRVILSANAGVSEEIKWRKPSRPEGAATWVNDGNICMADLLKNAVRLTFPKGALVDDPTNLFNTRLERNSVRAVDYFEDANVDEVALGEVVRRAAALNRTS